MILFQIQGLVKKVENILKQQSKNEKTIVGQVYTEKQVLQAISQVIYKHERFSVAFNVKTNNLDVARVCILQFFSFHNICVKNS